MYKKGLIIISLLIPVACAYLYFNRSTEVTFSIQKLSEKINLSSTYISEACSFHANDDGIPDFLLLTQSSVSHEMSSPLILLMSQGNSWVYKALESYRAFHPRNCAKGDFNGDGLDDIIIADHGPDRPPFPGAEPIMLLSTRNDWPKKADSEFFASRKSFNFNVLAGDINNDASDDIILVNILASPSELFLNKDFKKFIDNSEMLPDYMLKVEKKFLGAALIDLDLDGDLDLVLGGHGGDGPNENFLNDVALFNDGNHFSEIRQDFFPTRTGLNKMSSVEIQKLNLNNDQYTDIAVLYHTVGFMSEGHVDFYVNDNGKKFKKVELTEMFKKPQGLHWWFARGTRIKNNDRRLDDFVLLPKITENKQNIPHPQALYFQNTGGRMTFKPDVLGSVSSSIVAVFNFDYNKDGMEDLLMITYSGEVLLALRN